MNEFLAFRLLPNQDLKAEISRLCYECDVKAGCIVSAVGSLKHAKIRLADSTKIFESPQKFEIVSITGTISTSGCHIHLSLADSEGKVVGGHLLEGNTIYTTCELVILKLVNTEFKRELDPETGYNELKIIS